MSEIDFGGVISVCFSVSLQLDAELILFGANTGLKLNCGTPQERSSDGLITLI